MKNQISASTNVEALSLDDLILGKFQLETLNNGYADVKLSAPDWVFSQIAAIGNEIKRRTRDELNKRLQTAMARRSALRTPDEKRKDLDKKIEDLQKMME